MSEAEAFFDSDLILTLLSGDAVKADRAEELLAIGGTISTQVLDEFASVASRKLHMSWAEIREVLLQLRVVCPVEPVTAEINERAIGLAERYRLAFYDALIVAAALSAGCSTLYSERLQDGQVFERQLTVRHPFRDAQS